MKSELTPDVVTTISAKCCKKYMGMAYDEHCFWAWDEGTDCTIYKLNYHLEELESIELCSDNTNCQQAAGLSYHPNEDTLLAAFPNFIAEYSS